MPFDPAPQVKTGQFQRYADAIMAGCQKSPVQCVGHFLYADATCALGAMALGLGFRVEDSEDPEEDIERFIPNDVCVAYDDHYGATIPDDNDKNGFTREQIAARIAAL